MNFNYLIKQISTAETSGSLLNVYFYMGRFAYLVLYFQPLTTGLDTSALNPPQALSTLASISKAYQNITQSVPFVAASEAANATLSFFGNAVGASGQNVTACENNLRAVQMAVSTFDSDMVSGDFQNIGNDLAALMQLLDPVVETCCYGLID